MYVTSEGETISEAQHAAAMITGAASTTYTGLTRVVSARMPLLLACHIQAIAHMSSVSRNAMVASIMKVGIEAIYAELSDEAIAEIGVLTSDLVEIGLSEVQA